MRAKKAINEAARAEILLPAEKGFVPLFIFI
jgi:hypothetical protein